MKAADIPDIAFLEMVRRFNDGEFPDEAFDSQEYRTTGHGGWAFVWDIAGLLRVPGRVAEAKAAKLIRRGFMDGCAARHWCRGDYELTRQGRDLLDAVPVGAPGLTWRNPEPVSEAESTDNPYV